MTFYGECKCPTYEGQPFDYRKKCVGMRQSRIPTHPDLSVIVLEVIQSKATPKRDYTSAAGVVIKLFTGYFQLINRRVIYLTYIDFLRLSYFFLGAAIVFEFPSAR
ncbi:hypothetical protein GGGNBK_20530 [Sporosarcina sp. ANT_H38]